MTTLCPDIYSGLCFYSRFQLFRTSWFRSLFRLSSVLCNKLVVKFVSSEEIIALAMRKIRDASAQVDPAHIHAAGNELERAIGSQVRRYRKQLGLTVAGLADRAGLSSGMLSKIENGNTSPSLATLRVLSIALNVPVTALFRQFEEQRLAQYQY